MCGYYLQNEKLLIMNIQIPKPFKINYYYNKISMIFQILVKCINNDSCYLSYKQFSNGYLCLQQKAIFFIWKTEWHLNGIAISPVKYLIWMDQMV